MCWLFCVLALVKLLLNNHAILEVRDNDGLTPLLYSVKYNEYDIFRYLVKIGANVDAVDNAGNGIQSYASNKFKQYLKNCK